MKKIIFIMVLFTIITVFSFAKGFAISAGSGALTGYTFSRYSLKGGNVTSTQSMDRFNYGGILFVDARYGELAVIFQSGTNSYSENMIYTVTSLTDSKGKGWESSLGFSLLGKYPFLLSKRITWFPMIGIEYHIALTQKRQPEGDYVYDRTDGVFAADCDKNGNPYPLSAWNYFLIDVGAGMDYSLTGPIFLRGELLFGIRMPTGYELGALQVVKNPPMNITNPKMAGLTGTPALRICAGYRF